MQLDHNRHGLVIAGRSGSGKTSYLARYLRGAPAQVRFVFDPDGPLTMRLGAHSSAIAWDPVGMVDRLGSGWVIFNPSRMFPGDNRAGFDFFARWAWNVSGKMRGRKIFASDEIQKYVPPTGAPGEGCALVWDTGRQHGLDSAVIAQGGNRVHELIRAQTTELVTFQLVSRRGLEWPGDLGLDLKELQALGKGEFIAFDLEGGAKHRGNLFGFQRKGKGGIPEKGAGGNGPKAKRKHAI